MKVRCSACNTVFVVPKGQNTMPSKCGNCGSRGTLSTVEKQWTCLHCGTVNAIDLTSCQGCKIDRNTQKTTLSGKHEHTGRQKIVRPVNKDAIIPRRDLPKVILNDDYDA